MIIRISKTFDLFIPPHSKYLKGYLYVYYVYIYYIYMTVSRLKIENNIKRWIQTKQVIDFKTK